MLPKQISEIMKVKAKCYRDLSSWGIAGCGVIEFHRGTTYEFDVEEKIELGGLVKYNKYSICLPQEGIVGNPTRTVYFFDRHFASCYFFGDWFLPPSLTPSSN